MRKILLTIICSLSLISCGFKLRNQNDFPQALHSLYIESANSYGSFENMLHQALQAAGINVTTQEKDAAVILHVISTNLINASSSIGPSSITRVYNLTYQVQFELLTATRKTILAPQTINVYQTLTLQANELLNNNNQVNALQQDMQRDAIDQLFNILSSKQVAKTLQSP